MNKRDDVNQLQENATPEGQNYTRSLAQAKPEYNRWDKPIQCQEPYLNTFKCPLLVFQVKWHYRIVINILETK